MSDRAELLEATLDTIPDGVGLMGENCQLVFWNHAAQAITGYASIDLMGRPVPESLRMLLDPACSSVDNESPHHRESAHGTMVHMQHKQGHSISAMARHFVLRDDLGHRIGTAVLFHPAECLDALPHGETGNSENIEASQEDLKDRLESLFKDFSQGGLAFGVLWISVDQAHELRKTHGAGACESMLQKVERALLQGLRPAEHLGRWGEDEFLVISHERTAAMLATHAQALAGFTRTADFRWWGDRVSLTVSIGAAQAESGETLAQLLEKTKAAMRASFHAGGNHITAAPEGHTCSPS